MPDDDLIRLHAMFAKCDNIEILSEAKFKDKHYSCTERLQFLHSSPTHDSFHSCS